MHRAVVPGTDLAFADFSRLPVRHPYIAMVPQWDLLDLLAAAGREEASFDLRMQHEVTGLVRESGRVTGVRYESPEGPGTLLADLVVACDGRWSVVRREVGLPRRELPVGFDAWWVKVPTDGRLAGSLVPRFGQGRTVILIPREGYAQVAYLLPKGSDARLRAAGLDGFRADLVELAPELADGVTAIESLDEVKLLDVRMDRLQRWHAPGVLCLGDAAHAMSPMAGVGINLAVQDAVAAARLLVRPLRDGLVGPGSGDSERAVLQRIQRRRTWPAVIVQTLQRFLDKFLIGPVLAGRETAFPRPLVALLRTVPALSVVPAALVGIGPRPERAPRWARRPVRSPAG